MKNADIRSNIKDLLSRGNAYTTYEIVGYLHIATGKRISESACSARIRELRNPRFGGHTVKTKPRSGRTAWEYTIPTNQQQEA